VLFGWALQMHVGVRFFLKCPVPLERQLKGCCSWEGAHIRWHVHSRRKGHLKNKNKKGKPVGIYTALSAYSVRPGPPSTSPPACAVRKTACWAELHTSRFRKKSAVSSVLGSSSYPAAAAGPRQGEMADGCVVRQLRGFKDPQLPNIYDVR
jgi:hypothetical protein